MAKSRPTFPATIGLTPTRAVPIDDLPLALEIECVVEETSRHIVERALTRDVVKGKVYHVPRGTQQYQRAMYG